MVISTYRLEYKLENKVRNRINMYKAIKKIVRELNLISFMVMLLLKQVDSY